MFSLEMWLTDASWDNWDGYHSGSWQLDVIPEVWVNALRNAAAAVRNVAITLVWWARPGDPQKGRVAVTQDAWTRGKSISVRINLVCCAETAGSVCSAGFLIFNIRSLGMSQCTSVQCHILFRHSENIPRADTRHVMICSLIVSVSGLAESERWKRIYKGIL